VRARIDGEVNKPVLSRRLAIGSGEAVVLFVSQFDAYLQPSRTSIANLDTVASRIGATVVLLGAPPNVVNYVQRDGLHPNGRRQLLIAGRLEPVLRAMHLCPTK